jgi:hypothetical protein
MSCLNANDLKTGGVTAIAAALTDPALHRLSAQLDVLRAGRARERSPAGKSMEAELRQAVAAVFLDLLSNPDFTNTLPGLITEPERAGVVMRRMQAMCT